MTNLLISTLPQISDTTLYLARRKNPFILYLFIFSQAVPKVVYDLGLVDTDVHCESINICAKYSLLLNKFAECHQMLNGKIEFEGEKVEGLLMRKKAMQ